MTFAICAFVAAILAIGRAQQCMPTTDMECENGWSEWSDCLTADMDVQQGVSSHKRKIDQMGCIVPVWYWQATVESKLMRYRKNLPHYMKQKQLPSRKIVIRRKLKVEERGLGPRKLVKRQAPEGPPSPEGPPPSPVAMARGEASADCRPFDGNQEMMEKMQMARKNGSKLLYACQSQVKMGKFSMDQEFQDMVQKHKDDIKPEDDDDEGMDYTPISVQQDDPGNDAKQKNVTDIALSIASEVIHLAQYEAVVNGGTGAFHAEPEPERASPQVTNTGEGEGEGGGRGGAQEEDKSNVPFFWASKSDEELIGIKSKLEDWKTTIVNNMALRFQIMEMSMVDFDKRKSLVDMTNAGEPPPQWVKDSYQTMASEAERARQILVELEVDDYETLKQITSSVVPCNKKPMISMPPNNEFDNNEACPKLRELVQMVKQGKEQCPNIFDKKKLTADVCHAFPKPGQSGNGMGGQEGSRMGGQGGSGMGGHGGSGMGGQGGSGMGGQGGSGMDGQEGSGMGGQGGSGMDGMGGQGGSGMGEQEGSGMGGQDNSGMGRQDGNGMGMEEMTAEDLIMHGSEHELLLKQCNKAVMAGKQDVPPMLYNLLNKYNAKGKQPEGRRLPEPVDLSEENKAEIKAYFHQLEMLTTEVMGLSLDYLIYMMVDRNLFLDVQNKSSKFYSIQMELQMKTDEMNGFNENSSMDKSFYTNFVFVRVDECEATDKHNINACPSLYMILKSFKQESASNRMYPLSWDYNDMEDFRKLAQKALTMQSVCHDAKDMGKKFKNYMDKWGAIEHGIFELSGGRSTFGYGHMENSIAMEHNGADYASNMDSEVPSLPVAEEDKAELSRKLEEWKHYKQQELLMRLNINVMLRTNDTLRHELNSHRMERQPDPAWFNSTRWRMEQIDMKLNKLEETIEEMAPGMTSELNSLSAGPMMCSNDNSNDKAKCKELFRFFMLAERMFMYHCHEMDMPLEEIERQWMLSDKDGQKEKGQDGNGKHGSKEDGEHGSKKDGNHGSKEDGEHGSKQNGGHGSKEDGLDDNDEKNDGAGGKGKGGGDGKRDKDNTEIDNNDDDKGKQPDGGSNEMDVPDYEDDDKYTYEETEILSPPSASCGFCARRIRCCKDPFLSWVDQKMESEVCEEYPQACEVQPMHDGSCDYADAMPRLVSELMDDDMINPKNARIAKRMQERARDKWMSILGTTAPTMHCTKSGQTCHCCCGNYIAQITETGAMICRLNRGENGCGPNEEYAKCSNGCEGTCDDPDPMCPHVCKDIHAGCKCQPGTVRHGPKCVPRDQCP